MLTAGSCEPSLVESLDAPLLEISSAIAAPQYSVDQLSEGEATPLAGTASPTGFSPAQIRHAYGYDQIFFEGGSIVGDGTGQTIAIVNAYHTPNAYSDLAAFSDYFDLPMPPSFIQVDQTGGTNYPITSGSWALETALDIQWAHALAPAANILLVEATTATFDNLGIGLDYARSQPGVSAISMSWGGPEWSSELSYDAHFATPSEHANVTYFAAAGNSGSPGVYPGYSASVMAVGGTNLALDSQGNILGESAWGSGGGGVSLYEPRPTWQVGVVPHTPSNRRAMPDVAFDADHSSGVSVYDSFNNGTVTPWTKVGGTSFATPSWAALITIANQGRNLAGLPVLDIPELMTAIYAMPQSNFYDITITGGGTSQPAEPGYDLVTGRGTPKANLIVEDLVGLGSIFGIVFDDANGNGVLDGETGLPGWSVYADLDADATLDALATNTFVSSDVPQTIQFTSTVTSDRLVSGLNGRIVDANVTLDIDHARDSDLVITLISPTGTRVTLASGAGGAGDDFSNTVFDDSAPVAIEHGLAPFGSSYHPAEMLLDLFGENPNGTWTLEVQDTSLTTNGTLNSWSLELTTGDPSAVSAADGSYYIDALPAFSYQIREVLQSPYTQTSPGGGFYTVNLAAADHVGGQDLGNQVPVYSAVVARHLFYNRSAFDGSNVDINVSDDAAIATDKTAYLPGDGLAAFGNVSSYSRGINGIMIDISGSHPSINANDFVFKMGNNNTPASWTAAPTPAAISVRAGAGTSGADRVEITWADGAIANAWLEVQVLPTSRTALSAADVFFWGSKVGDVGDPTANSFTTTAAGDAAAILAGGLGPATGITDVRDIDRSNVITAAGDRSVAVANIGAITRIDIGSGGPFVPEDGDGDDQAANPPILALAAPSAVQSAAPLGSVEATPQVAPSTAGGFDQPASGSRQLGLAAAAETWRWFGRGVSFDGLDDELVDLLAAHKHASARRR